MASLAKNIKLVDSENLALKSSLLSLIHDYKYLKDLVLNKGYGEVEDEDLDKNVHKRSYGEVEVKEQLDSEIATSALMNELINDMNDLSYTKKSQSKRKFNHYKDFEKLDTVEDSDGDIDFEDDEDDDALSPSSTALSRTTSPSSDFENNSLMSSLTRSTTVSSVNTITNQVPMLDKKGYPFKNSSRLFELPRFEEHASSDTYSFQFDDALNADQDQYHRINDFLEEKLLTNDLDYYVENQYGDRKW
ncbi:uncharacterized protein CANTADRAFT_22511 [Suhomyces tanzawaensis NRRL Y-17324]|uniref:Uncharacterized protein n=1 Tax=Suhomyces tanzawaensis NRRL Y-17324 TaxID=984487 RepID=A0A1E4SG80_9ASCO|nr:uncharacterized protein CANTADRAFT_22511 [Suhomyces tanzawaensis NRRL Y-17324]ODV78521.1 hypothetical protein CANTADRAFT_22511 [Suhomyces tanzawaensis NRRL Y-17324]